MKVLLIAAAFVILIGAVFSYFAARAAFAASGALGGANVALESARKHTLDYDSQLKAMISTSSLNSSATNSNAGVNFAQIKQAADTIGSKLSEVQLGVRADRGRLGGAGRDLQAANANPLALPFRSSMAHSQSRVESLMSALAAADSAVALERDEIRALSAFMDMMSDYVTLGNKEKAGDVPGSLAVFTTLDPKTQTATQAVQGQDIPSELASVVRAIATTVADEKAVLQATQAHDSNRVRAALAKYDADSTAAQKLDTSQIGNQERTLLQPYIDRYESGVKAAGFTLT